MHNIRGLHVDYKKLYIFTATNKGDISVLDLGLPGKEKLINEIIIYYWKKIVSEVIL